MGQADFRSMGFALLAALALRAPAFAVSPSFTPPPSPAGSAEILYAEDGVTPISIRAPLPKPSAALSKLSAEERDQAQCFAFLASFAPQFNLGDARRAFRVTDKAREGADAEFRLRQTVKGVPVFGSDCRVRLSGGTGMFLGRIRQVTPPAGSAAPDLKAQEAVDRALADLSRITRVSSLTPEQSDLLEETGPETDLVYYPSEDAKAEPRLAWHVKLRANLLEAWEYVVDARSGEVLLKYPVSCTFGPAEATAKDLKAVARTFGTYQYSKDSKYYLIDASRPMFNATKSVFPDKTVGAIVTMDMQNSPVGAPNYKHVTSSTNTWTNTKAVSAHFNAGTAYEYYRTVHGRNSINGQGGNILSFVNVADNDGSALDNAFWNGKAMFYGNGKSIMKPLAAALDVSGHELTHGVVQATCALTSYGQSGALNESLADIFGSMIERVNWKMGEDIVKTGIFATGCLRDLSNPHNGSVKGSLGWQPASMSEFQKLPNTIDNDMGGVHVNDGIPNRAYYLFATAVGKEKAEQVYYRAMTKYLTSSAQFTDMRVAAVQSAKDLFSDVEVAAAENAFDQVGIKASGPVSPKRDAFAVNPGAQFVLLTKAGAAGGSTLYLADSAFANAKALTSTPVKSRPSVTDDGSLAVFVSGDGRIISLRTDPSAPHETVLDAGKVWEMAAISKDGLHYAAVKSEPDSSIYIGTIGVTGMKQYPLYNPTFEGLRTGGVVNAGTVDWDYSGDVVYDAYNQIKGTGGSPITYWDVGFLRAWDDSARNFADGTISKLFSNLPDGVSIGNAAFARNSPDVVVFEYLDANSGSFSIQAMDMNTRKTGILAQNNVISWPSFAKRDDGVAYTTVSGSDTGISEVTLKADKISPAGNPRKVISGYKWPVFLAKGVRFSPNSSMPRPGLAGNLEMQVRYDRVTGRISVDYALASPSRVRVSIFSADGRLVKAAESQESGGPHAFDWQPSEAGTAARAGLFLVKLDAGVESRTAKVLAGF
jgi:bacillolysin